MRVADRRFQDADALAESSIFMVRFGFFRMMDACARFVLWYKYGFRFVVPGLVMETATWGFRTYIRVTTPLHMDVNIVYRLSSNVAVNLHKWKVLWSQYIRGSE